MLCTRYMCTALIQPGDYNHEIFSFIVAVLRREGKESLMAKVCADMAMAINAISTLSFQPSLTIHAPKFPHNYQLLCRRRRAN